MKIRLLSILTLFYGFVIFLACNKTKSETVASCNYDPDIKQVIASKCALPSCHGGGATVGDFTQYNQLKARVDNGRLRTNVFDLKIMPPSTVDSLTIQEKEKLKCWLDNGAPQN